MFNHENIDVIVDSIKGRNIKLDVLVGGAPCQEFSIAGPRDMKDKRNSLYLAMVELAHRLQPQAVVLENVPGMILMCIELYPEQVINLKGNHDVSFITGLIHRQNDGNTLIKVRL